MADEGGPPSGHWAADPTGRHRFRWWDGTQWTGSVYDGEVAPTRPPSPSGQPASDQLATDPPASGQPGTAPTDAQPAAVELGAAEAALHRRERRAIQRRSFWTGALAGGLLVAIVAVLAWVTVGGNDSTSTTTTTRQTTTTTEATTTTTIPVTTTTLAPGRPPQQVRVQVMNGSGVAGAAATKATSLQGLGYVIAGTGDATARQGTVVQCNAGFEAEAAALAQAVGSGATVQATGATVPTNADCVVVLGT